MVVEERIEELEARVEAMERRIRAFDGAPVAAAPVRAAPAPRRLPAPRTLRFERPSVPDLEQLLGGRVLAWLGGAAVLVGLAFLLALAIASGWLGELARTLLAGGASLALVGGGIAPHERHGRVEAGPAVIRTRPGGGFPSPPPPPRPPP